MVRKEYYTLYAMGFNSTYYYQDISDEKCAKL